MTLIQRGKFGARGIQRGRFRRPGGFAMSASKARAGGLAIAGLLTLPAAACGPPPPPHSSDPMPPPPPAASVAPAPPPPPQAEVIPPSPGSTVVWEAGHWSWTGGTWVWVAGHYEQRPQPTAQWVPGHWAQNAGGGQGQITCRWPYTPKTAALTDTRREISTRHK